MKLPLIILTFTLLIAVSCKHSGPPNQYHQTILNAEKSNRLILLDFTAKWCGGCKAYDKYVFQDSSFIKKLDQEFILLKVDYEIPENSTLMERYRITGLPHIVMIDTKEHILGSVEGFDSKYAEEPQLFFLKLRNIVNSQTEINAKEKIFNSDTNDIETITQLLDLYKRVNQHIGIQRLTNLLVKLNPTPDRLFEFRFQEAIEKLQKEYNPKPIQSFVNENPDLDYQHTWEAYSQLLYFYRDINDIENQDKYYIQLIKIDPNYFKHHYIEFLFEHKLKLDTAIILTREYNSNIELRNTFWGQYLNAHALASIGKIEDAVQQYSSWMDRNEQEWLTGEDYWILYFYARFANFYNVDLEKALSYIQIAEKNRNMIDEKILMAEILFKLGQINESIEKLEESLNYTKNPNEYKRIVDKIEEYKTTQQLIRTIN